MAPNVFFYHIEYGTSRNWYHAWTESPSYWMLSYCYKGWKPEFCHVNCMLNGNITMHKGPMSNYWWDWDRSVVIGWMVYFQFRFLVLSQEDQVQDSSRHIFLVGQPRRSQCSWCATLTGQPDFRSPTSLLIYLEGHPCMPNKELKIK